jgi:hypothetical protein
MKAKKMFDELGYDQDKYDYGRSYNGGIPTYVISYSSQNRVIKFEYMNLPTKGVCGQSYGLTGKRDKHLSTSFSIEEHKAIHQQMKELDWI